MTVGVEGCLRYDFSIAVQYLDDKWYTQKWKHVLIPFFVLSYLSLAGNHTIAIIKEKEHYESLKASLANVIHDVNSLVSDGHVVVDGQKVNLDVYLGGDYKVNEVIWTTFEFDVLIII